MAFLSTNNGPDPGRRYELTRDEQFMGRSPACEISVDVGAVSRQHAKIVHEHGVYFVEDLKSRNGTFVNGRSVSDERHRLRDGDRIRICDVEFTFRSSGDPSVHLADADHELGSVLIDDDDQASSIASAVMTEVRVELPKDEFYELIGRNLQRNHVHCPDIGSSELEQEMRDADTPARQHLQRNFFKVVLLNARNGLDDKGQFDLMKFLQYAFREMSEAFDIRLSDDDFHAELIPQYLKDEPRSLFCFLNIDLIPEDTIRRLRGFTQEGHQCLFCGNHPLDGVKRETVYRTAERRVQLAASPEAKLKALLEIQGALGRALSLDDVLPVVLDSLFKIFPRADRGFIIQKDSEGRIIPAWIKQRRADSEDAVRISRTIVNQVMDSKQAILSADAANDVRFEMSQSIADFRIRSMMCAPLLDSNGNVLGVLQIDTLDQRQRFQEEDLDLLAGVAVQAGIAIDNAQLHELALKQQGVERDLELAREVLVSFLPKRPPQLDGYQFFDFYQPAAQVGGDYYDYISLPQGKMAIVVADAVGRGVAASLMVAKIAAELRLHLASEPSVDVAMSKLNKSLCDLNLNRFVTMVLIVLDAKTHELSIVNAGHMAPIHCQEDGSLEEPGESVSGLPLGIEGSVEYAVHQMSLAAGESITMYTDGINECCNQADELYGIERLRNYVAANKQTAPKELGLGIMEDVHKHQGDAIQCDDMCMVLFRREP